MSGEMDPNSVRGLVNQILYGVDQVAQLTDELVKACADSILDRRHFSHPVEEYAEAIARTIQEGRLDPQSIDMSRRHSEAAILDFLGRLDRHLAERRPWPRPPFLKRDVGEWASFADARPIARIVRPTHQINGILNNSFDEVPAGAGKLPVIILELRSGEVVALLGSADPRSTTFYLLPRDPADPTQLIERFREFTGFGTEDITAITDDTR
jgi:hypothetical protein